MKILSIIKIIAFAALFAVAACVAPSVSQNRVGMPEGLASMTLTAQGLDAAETGVRTSLKDPDSAKFSSVMAFTDGDQVHVCGFVNAKNSFGGYTGDTPFHSQMLALADKQGVMKYLHSGTIIATRSYVGVSAFYKVMPGCKAVGYLNPESLL